MKKFLCLMLSAIMLVSCFSLFGACGNTKFKVSFDTDGGSAVEDQYVSIGEHAVRPANDPVKDGYVFDDWYYSDNVLWNFDTYKITKDTVIKAKWKRVITYTVTFDSNGGSSVPSQTVETGKKIEKPTDPSRSQYVFDCWEYNSDAWNFETDVVLSDMTLRAKWILKDYNCTYKAGEYSGITAFDNIDDIVTYSDDTSNDNTDNGVIVSPYYTLTVNGEEVDLYASRSANGIHSFANIDVKKTNEDKDFILDIELTPTEFNSVMKKKKVSCTVLPKRNDTSANVADGKVYSTLTDYGTYSFVFNNNYEEPVTITVTKSYDLETLFNGKNIRYIEPGDYSSDEHKLDFHFTEENTVYYFKSGRYKIYEIHLPSNSVLYIDFGAYMEIMPRVSGIGTEGFMIFSNRSDIAIYCRGLLDFSPCCGAEPVKGPGYNKHAIRLYHMENVVVDGLNVINSMSWTLCFYNGTNIHINNAFFIAYRIYADGIMLSDCIDSVVENSFIRTGDDAFETKSTTAGSNIHPNNNIVFRNNDCWTDKAVAYGCIYETRFDTQNVRFENCSVGFALGTWSPHLGCCVIQMGNWPDITIHDVTFEDIEIFYSTNQAIINCFIGGTAGRVDGGNGIIRDIYFKNITAETNRGKVVNIQTRRSENSFIYDIYVDNIVSNKIKLLDTEEHRKTFVNIDVKSGYDPTQLHINSLSD